MTNEQIIEWCEEVGVLCGAVGWIGVEDMRAFVRLVRNATLEEVDDAYSDALQSDLEHGVRALSERAANKFKAKYPELAKFPDAIRAMKEES